MNDYNLDKPKRKVNTLKSLKKFFPFIESERKSFVIAIFAIIAGAGLNLLAPILIGIAIDKYILTQQYRGIFIYALGILIIYIAALAAMYIQTIIMGSIGQHLLFNLRGAIFNKIQSLPISFFNQNKTGDLISRINNDTEKLNLFFSQSIHPFIGNAITIIGAAAFILVINWRLAVAALSPAFILLIFTRLISPWIKHQNAKSLKKVGALSAEIAEGLEYFKVVIAFNRRDFFRHKFQKANQASYTSALAAGQANNILTPTYGLASNAAQLIVITYGVYLISMRQISLGILISFLTYITRFYDPLRQIAAIWTYFQTALAGWDRIDDILSLKSNLLVLPNGGEDTQSSLLEFKDVTFRYNEEKIILHKINLKLEAGKTYALVGPTGGGKTTTASLMARLYDPTEGQIRFNGRDLRMYAPEERAKKIGFILQDPFLFAGTIHDNIIYGNEEIKHYNDEQLAEVIESFGLKSLLSSFDEGLQTKIELSGGSLSLGQKQLVAFIRAVLRKPDLLILDEATANIDTVTEQLLEEIINKLPKSTTRVIIAHRLNTIANADEIFFVNSGEIISAGSMDRALELLKQEKRES